MDENDYRLISQKLLNCIDQCAYIERLLSQDAADMAQCVTGDVCQQYQQLIDQTKTNVSKLKRELRNQHNELMSVML